MKRVLFYPSERIIEIDTLKLLLNDRYYWVPLANSIGCKDKICSYSGFCKDCNRRIVNMFSV